MLLNLKSTFFDSKLPLDIAENSNIKYKITAEGKKGFIFTKGGSNPPEPSDNNNLNNSRPKRSPEELEVARAAKKAKMVQKPGETDEKFNQRVNKAEKKEYSILKSKLNVNDSSGDNPNKRSSKELEVARKEAGKFIRRREGESDEQLSKRIKIRESNVWQQRGDKNSVDYAPKRRNPWEIANSVNNLRELYPQLPFESMAEWTDRLSLVEKNQYQLLKNPSYTPKGPQGGLSYKVPKIIIDSVRSNDPWDGIENRKKYTNRTYLKAERIYEKGDTNYENNLPSNPPKEGRG